jgi:hypothetical protein
MTKVIQNFLTNVGCIPNGQHDLIEIYSECIDSQTEAVVRWCYNCGAIVVDADCDNRISPGYYRKIQIPELIRK